MLVGTSICIHELQDRKRGCQWTPCNNYNRGYKEHIIELKNCITAFPTSSQILCCSSLSNSWWIFPLSHKLQLFLWCSPIHAFPVLNKFPYPSAMHLLWWMWNLKNQHYSLFLNTKIWSFSANRVMLWTDSSWCLTILNIYIDFTILIVSHYNCAFLKISSSDY